MNKLQNKLLDSQQGQATFVNERRHGHPLFYSLTQKENELHESKNRSYSGEGDPLGNFNRVASLLALYPGLDYTDPSVVLLFYTLKHVDALIWSFTSKASDKKARKESAPDISVYMKILQCIEDDKDVPF